MGIIFQIFLRIIFQEWSVKFWYINWTFFIKKILNYHKHIIKIIINFLNILWFLMELKFKYNKKLKSFKLNSHKWIKEIQDEN
jgi:hypothetical protein